MQLLVKETGGRYDIQAVSVLDLDPTSAIYRLCESR